MSITTPILQHRQLNVNAMPESLELPRKDTVHEIALSALKQGHQPNPLPHALNSLTIEALSVPHKENTFANALHYILQDSTAPALNSLTIEALSVPHEEDSFANALHYALQDSTAPALNSLTIEALSVPYEENAFAAALHYVLEDSTDFAPHSPCLTASSSVDPNAQIPYETVTAVLQDPEENIPSTPPQKPKIRIPSDHSDFSRVTSRHNSKEFNW